MVLPDSPVMAVLVESVVRRSRLSRLNISMAAINDLGLLTWPGGRIRGITL